MTDEKSGNVVFVVGNPRSGTTMLGLMLGNHQSIHTFHELHFFDKLWDPKQTEKEITKAEALILERKLRTIESQDILKNRGRLDNEMPEILPSREFPDIVQRSSDVYTIFLLQVTQANSKTIPCEQTPGYLYYVNEIQARLPDSKFIHIVRDPRDVLLSQKKKWQSQSLKKENPALFEKIRLWVNYHPVTTSLIWRAAIKRSSLQSEKSSFYNVRYEDIGQNPEKELRSICKFLNINYTAEMLNVSRAGSSIKNYNAEEKGVDSARESHWLQDGLTNTEIFLCQKINKIHMKKFGYSRIVVKTNPLHLLICLLTFPLKLFMTIVLHIFHFKNLTEAIRRRI
ncbi:MAG: sulfotransferase [Bacteroidetes bacterium]|nr:sulfotransferase [Bacteroidota bacterium]